jgi:hypothetical protein
MEYLNRDKLVRLFKVARNHNPLHHVAMLVGLLHGPASRPSQMSRPRIVSVSDTRSFAKSCNRRRFLEQKQLGLYQRTVRRLRWNHIFGSLVKRRTHTQSTTIPWWTWAILFWILIQLLRTLEPAK